MMELPSSKENPMRTHGRKGAWKLSRPKKFMRTLGLRLLHTYTSMIVNAWPRNTRLTNMPNIYMCTLRGKKYEAKNSFKSNSNN